MTDLPAVEPEAPGDRERAPMVSLAAINTVQQALRKADFFGAGNTRHGPDETGGLPDAGRCRSG